jgi:aminoglycoside phosphotransferase family enzyme/predicted kinase
MDLDELIAALSLPSAYLHPVSEVEVRQTHISAVFLAGPYAFKLKKPVKLAFLDFSTLEKRKHFCEEEVRLNRRLAADTYLGVVPIVATSEGVRVESDGEVLDWAVKMRRLPETATLLERLRRSEVGTADVEAIGERIASFHRSAETSERIARFGRFEGVSRIILDVLDQSVPHRGRTVSESVHRRVRELIENTLDRFHDLIDSRAARKMPRDTHGDLHLDHIYLFPEREPPGNQVIVDCIEFNERFRFTDPIADSAFPVMDFVFRGRRDLAKSFADAYIRSSGDDEGAALLPLYTAYRATVRGSVEGLLLEEKEVPQAERQAALPRARAHWLLALGELEEPARKPCLVMVGGLPGTGKSSVAAGLAERAGFSVIRSDVVRKELAGLPGDPQKQAMLLPAMYSADWTERTYAECLHRAEALLFEGKRVLIDATFREERQRRLFLDAAVRSGVPAAFLMCETTPAMVRRRLEQRRGDVSDADWSIYLEFARAWEPPGADTEQSMHRISTEGSRQSALSAALEQLQQLGLC